MSLAPARERSLASSGPFEYGFIPVLGLLASPHREVDPEQLAQGLAATAAFPGMLLGYSAPGSRARADAGSHGGY